VTYQMFNSVILGWGASVATVAAAGMGTGPRPWGLTAGMMNPKPWSSCHPVTPRASLNASPPSGGGEAQASGGPKASDSWGLLAGSQLAAGLDPVGGWGAFWLKKGPWSRLPRAIPADTPDPGQTTTCQPSKKY